MREITNYTVAQRANRDELVAEVKRLIAIGWQPYGYLVFAPRTRDFIQVMVKYEEDNG